MFSEELQPINRLSAQDAVATDVPDQLAKAVLSVALYEPDLHWAQEYCIKVASNTNPIIRGNAILSLGHLARIHKKALSQEAYRLVATALSDPEEYVRGQADCAADDIEHFLQYQLRAKE